jgi:F-type H+-transporting ATPase subunit b
MGINSIFLVSQLINLGILVIVLVAFLWKPMMKQLDARREMLEKEKQDADALAAARANIEAERAGAFEKARGEADKIVAEAREQASALTEKAAREARQATDAALAEARQSAEEERNRTLGEMRGQIAALSIAAAQKVIGETLDEQRHRALVESFFSGVRDGRVEVLPEEIEAEGPVTVTSALPLTEKDESTIRQELTSRLGDVDLSFRVDPQILGGLVVRVGDRVMDGSVAAQLERLHQSLA